MNIVFKHALTGAALVSALGCATPVEIAGDVQRVQPGDFGDAGLAGGAGEGEASGGSGSGGSGADPSGLAEAGGSGPVTTAQGGTSAGLGGGPAAGGAGGTAAGTDGTPADAGGTPAAAGGTGSGGAGGTGSGEGGPAPGGAGGEGPGAGGETAAGGTGGVVVPAEPVFDADACDFDDLTGCEALTCAAACPTNDGGSCLSRCEPLVNCVSTEPACEITEDDPLCAERDQGQPNTCTTFAESAGGVEANQPQEPAFVARQLIECVCTSPRP